jgi:NADH:ubiquinone oxidoreductase subunit C
MIKKSFGFRIVMRENFIEKNVHTKHLFLNKYFVIYICKIIPLFLKSFLLKSNSIYIIINSSFLHYCIMFLKFNIVTSLSSLLDIIIVDYPTRLENRFELIYAFWNNKNNFRFFIKTFTNSVTPILSISSFFSSSSWLEREAMDMFGIKFLLHNDLRRILTDYGFQGYPLCKDFPLSGFIELRYDDLFQSIFSEPVEFSQKFRFFKFDNPWSKWK